MEPMLGIMVPILIVLIIVGGIVIDNWLRMRHGYPPQDDNKDKTKLDKTKLEAICAENGELKQQMKLLQERIAVMERIATDPAERTAREIESLR